MAFTSDFGTFGIADNRRSMFFFYIHYMIFFNKNAKYIKNYATTNQECMTCVLWKCKDATRMHAHSSHNAERFPSYAQFVIFDVNESKA